jgi:hypothetical protein
MGVTRRVVALAVVVIAAACGSSPTSPPSASSTAAVPSPATSATTVAPAVSPSAGPAWSVAPGSATGADPALLATVAALKTYPDTAAGFTVTGVRSSGDWAVLSAVASGSINAPAPVTETLMAIAHRTGSTWTVVTDRDATFCAVLASVPASVLSADERAYFGGCH